MLTMKELNPSGQTQSAEVEQNLEDLLYVINEVRKKYGKPMTVTSGLRTMASHLEIYRKKNLARKAAGLPPLAVPLRSKHLYGQAVDIADVDGDLWNWCMAHKDFLVNLGVHLEDESATPSWVHFQIVPPASGKFVFMP